VCFAHARSAGIEKFNSSNLSDGYGTYPRKSGPRGLWLISSGAEGVGLQSAHRPNGLGATAGVGCKLGPIFRKRLVIFCQKLVRTGQAAPQLLALSGHASAPTGYLLWAGERTLCCFIGKSAQRSERAGHPLASQALLSRRPHVRGQARHNGGWSDVSDGLDAVMGPALNERLMWLSPDR